jgi:predicted permease
VALISDFRAAVRALSTARGFTAIAVCSLGAGIALAVIILSVVNAYVVQGLPYPDADRLVRIDYAPPGQPAPDGMEELDWSGLSDVIEVPLAWDLDVFFLLGREYPESMPGAWVTPGYMEGFGIRAAIGRTFTAADYTAGGAPVALISHRLWHTRFNGDADIIGRTFQAYVSDRPEEPELFTIVGVLPPELWHLNVYTEVLAPLKAPTYPYMARLRVGVPATTAAERIDSFVRAGVSALPKQFAIVVTSAQESYIRTIRPVLWAITATAALVLLIAAANVAVLMLVRATRREKELAVRVALGASRLRLARLLIMEGLIVGLSATAAGLATASFAVDNLGPFVETFLERRVPGGTDALSIDARVVAVAGVCGLFVTVVFTALPLITSWRANVVSGLAASARGSTAARSGRFRAVLIGMEVAASLTLLIGAGLMSQTAVRMLDVDFGVDADDVLTASLALRERTFPDDASRVAFFDRLSTELARVAGSSVAFGDWWPLQGSRPRRTYTPGAEGAMTGANPFAVNSEYFATLGMTLRDGRSFGPQDRLGSEPVAIVSETLAQRLWPRRRAVGEPVTIEIEPNEQVTALVVGVVNDVRQSHFDTDLADLYLPLAQRPSRFAFVYVREAHAATPANDLRSAVARVNPEVAVGAPRQLVAGLEQERARPRFLALMLTTFAVAACVLALVGMHGVIAYAVRQRQREIAVRIAIGASARVVTRMFVRQGLNVLGAGVGFGIVGAWALGRVLESQLYGVRSTEPQVLAVAVFAFAVTGTAAIAWAAHRAAAIDPAVLLKEE